MNFDDCLDRLKSIKMELNADRNMPFVEYAKGVRGLHGESIVHFLAIEGELELVETLLESRFIVDETNEFGQTALLDVIRLSNLDMVKLLVKYGADVNFTDPEKNTPLHRVYSEPVISQEILNYLVSHGSRLDKRNVYGQKPADLRSLYNYKQDQEGSDDNK